MSVGKRKGFCFFKLQPSAACHFSAAKSTSADLTSRTAIDLYTPSVCDSSAGRASVDGSFPYGLRRAHGALNVFAWGVLMPVGAILARYFRRVDPLWFYLHVGIQFVGFIIGLAGVVAGVLSDLGLVGFLLLQLVRRAPACPASRSALQNVLRRHFRSAWILIVHGLIRHCSVFFLFCQEAGRRGLSGGGASDRGCSWPCASWLSCAVPRPSAS